MVSKQSVDEQLKQLGFNLNGWGRGEIKELPNILLPGEEIYELVNGTYEGGFALAVATDVRLLLVDKKPMNYLTVEDIRFDMISEIDYSHRILGAEIVVSTGDRDFHFRSYNQARLRKLIGHVQNCMADGKKQQSQNQQGQNQHLERINQQLKTYLDAQNEYQQQLQRLQQAHESNVKDLPVPPKPTPSRELSDYLFARSLLAQYEAQTGKKLQPELTQEVKSALAPESQSHMALPSRSELHELWSAGVQEVFGKRHQTATQQHNSFEIHPISIVFSRLPTVIRNRRFSQAVTQQLPTETVAT